MSGGHRGWACPGYGDDCAASETGASIASTRARVQQWEAAAKKAKARARARERAAARRAAARALAVVELSCEEVGR